MSTFKKIISQLKTQTVQTEHFLTQLLFVRTLYLDCRMVFKVYGCLLFMQGMWFDAVVRIKNKNQTKMTKRAIILKTLSSQNSDKNHTFVSWTISRRSISFKKGLDACFHISSGVSTNTTQRVRSSHKILKTKLTKQKLKCYKELSIRRNR